MSKNPIESNQFDNRSEDITPSPLARAIASRALKENAKQTFGLDMITGTPPPSSPLREETMLRNTAFSVQIILTSPPDVIESNVRFVDAMVNSMSDEACERFLFEGLDVELIGSIKPKLNPTQIRRITRGLYETSLSISPPATLEAISAQAAEARKMAEELGISPESIYATNHLYEDLVRRSSSPQKTATHTLQRLDLMTQERVEQYFDGYRIAVLHGLKDPEEQENAQRPNVQARRIAPYRLLEYKRARIDFLKEEVERFWGEGAFDQLPQDLRMRIQRHWES